MYEPISTHVAFMHFVRCFIQHRGAVRTGLGASSAADALFFVNQNESVGFTFEMCPGQTNLDANRVSVFVAGDRDIIRQLPAFFYSLPRGSLKTATVA